MIDGDDVPASGGPDRSEAQSIARASRFAAISRFLLDRTDEARRLASLLGVPLR